MRILRATLLLPGADHGDLFEAQFATPVEVRRGLGVRIFRVLVDATTPTHPTDETVTTVGVLSTVNGLTAIPSIFESGVLGRGGTVNSGNVVTFFGASTNWGPSGVLIATETLSFYGRVSPAADAADERVNCIVQYELENVGAQTLWLIQHTPTQIEGE